MANAKINALYAGSLRIKISYFFSKLLYILYKWCVIKMARCTVWSPSCYQGYIKKIEIIQRRATRYVGTPGMGNRGVKNQKTADHELYYGFCTLFPRSIFEGVQDSISECTLVLNVVQRCSTLSVL